MNRNAVFISHISSKIRVRGKDFSKEVSKIERIIFSAI